MRHQVLALHAGLMQFAPTIGNTIGYGLAMADVHGPEAGLRTLDMLSADRVQSHQPYWAARAHLLKQLDHRSEAAMEALQRAIGLAEDPAVRNYLLGQHLQSTSPSEP
jgi:RNA polymerase sigma-70 factor, ECF subfamily